MSFEKVYISPAGLRDIGIGMEGLERLIRLHEDEIDAGAITCLEQALDALHDFWDQLSYEGESGERFIWMEER